MTQLLEFRKKLIEIYQKIDYIVMPLLKFFLALCGFIAIKNVVGFNPKYSNIVIIILLSIVSAFLPTSLTIAIMVIYIALQLYNISVFMSITVVILSIILFSFFLRFVTKYSASVIGMPVLMGLKIPYTLPISFGLFCTPITIVPTCIGVFAYYFLKGIKANITTLEQVSSAKEPYVLFTNVLTNVLKNEAMFATMIVFALIIIVVYLVRHIKMDYSFEIATGVGAFVSMLGFIILMLKFDIDSGIFSIILFSILSAVISLVVYYVYRPLRYAATESVQFEDDDYYYYVKAIPKIKITGMKLNERQVINRRRDEEDDIDDEEFEDLESRIINHADDEIAGGIRNPRASKRINDENPAVRRQVINPNRGAVADAQALKNNTMNGLESANAPSNVQMLNAVSKNVNATKPEANQRPMASQTRPSVAQSRPGAKQSRPVTVKANQEANQARPITEQNGPALAQPKAEGPMARAEGAKPQGRPAQDIPEAARNAEKIKTKPGASNGDNTSNATKGTVNKDK